MNRDEAPRPQGGGAPDPMALSVLLRELVAAPPIPVAWGERLEPGLAIGRFELVRELGRGGFGVVWEARDRELGRSVAFKAVYPGTPAAAGEHLRLEAEAVARLAHPNLVTLFDVGRCDLGPYLVFELLRGRTLAQRLEEGPLPLGEALDIAVQVARGLAHAHAEGVVHRDLKPSNVFVCDGGTVKLLDFGMAHAFGRQRVSGGTPHYMAPEQRRGGAEDARTDLFALGVLLHRMVAGQLPFDDQGRPAGGRAAARLPAESGPPLQALGAELLEEDPARRPGSAEVVLRRLEAIRAASSPGARRRRWTLAAALAAAVLLGIVAGRAALAPRVSPLAPGPRVVAVLPFGSLGSGPEDATFAEGMQAEIITQLTRLAGLRVIAQRSTAAYPPGERDLGAIARALGADALLEGTVQRQGDRARLTVQLVDPQRATQLWAERYDRRVADVFGVQTEVAVEIARALGARLSPAERAALERPSTRDPEAAELLRRGLYFWKRSIGVDSDNASAEELIGRAAARDPSFAEAHAWLATIAVEWRGDCPAARVHLERAEALAPDRAEVHLAAGRLRDQCDGDARAAIREYEQAVLEAPGDAEARSLLGATRTAIGDQEGLEDLRVAFQLDPRSYYAAAELARELALVRRFDEAARACARAQELAPGDVHAMILAALIPFWRDGDLAPARRALAALPAELPRSGNGAWSLFQLLALLPEEAARLLEAGRVADPFSTGPFIPRDYVAGQALWELGRAEPARAAFARVVPALERRLASAPDDVLTMLFLARARVGAGQPRLAEQLVSRALSLAAQPWQRTSALRFAAEIDAAAGRRQEAVASLLQVLARPDGLLTAAAVRADPRFAPLRGEPRLQAMTRGHQPER